MITIQNYINTPNMKSNETKIAEIEKWQSNKQTKQKQKNNQ